jgi:hypothetical protein
MAKGYMGLCPEFCTQAGPEVPGRAGSSGGRKVRAGSGLHRNLARQELVWDPGAGRSGQAESSGGRKVRAGVRAGSGVNRDFARWARPWTPGAGSSGVAGSSGSRKFRDGAGSSGLDRKFAPLSLSSPSALGSSGCSLYLIIHICKDLGSRKLSLE